MLTVAAIALTAGLSAPANRAIATIPFVDNGKLIAVHVKIGSSRALFFTVDSGASASVIDSATARSLHLVASGTHLGSGAGAGPVRFDIFTNLPLAIGSVRWIAPQVYGASLKGTGTNVAEDGLIGSDFFAKYVVQVDYRRHRMTLFDPRSFRYAGRGEAIPTAFGHHRPFIHVVLKVAGRPAATRSVLVDSGSEDALDADLIARSSARKTPILGGVGLGRRFKTYFGPIQWAKIGSYTLRNLSGVSGGVALIGQTVLRNFMLTFDYTSRRIYFERTL